MRNKNCHQPYLAGVNIFIPVFILFIFISSDLIGQQLFLLAGQSNAVGQGDAAKSVQTDAGTAFEFDADASAFIPLRDPVGKPWKLFQQAGTGSVAPSFARRFHELSGKKVFVVTAARGGASCSVKAEMSNYDTWDETGRLFTQAVEKTRMAEKTSGVKLSGIIWMQGERDANAILAGQMTEKDYKRALVNLIYRFRESLGDGIPFYIIQTAFQQDKSPEGCQTVRNAQRTVSRKMKRVYLAYTETDQFSKRRWFKDNVHYNQDALNDIGQKTASFAYSKLFRKR